MEGSGRQRIEEGRQKCKMEDSGKRKVVEGRDSEKQKVMKGTVRNRKKRQRLGRLEALERKNKNAVDRERRGVGTL